MRICAVVGCGNSTYHIDRWRKKVCVINNVFHETGKCTCSRPFVLFPFPSEKADVEGRKRWTKDVNRKTVGKGTNGARNWIPTSDSRVCSIHFVDNKPTAANPNPTLNLGYSTRQITLRPPPKNRVTSGTPKRKRVDSNDFVHTERLQENVTVDHEAYLYRCDCKENCDCSGCVRKQKEIDSLRHENELLKLKLINHTKLSEKKHRQCDHDSFVSSDKNVKAFTGLPSKNAFSALTKYVAPAASKMTYWKGSRKSVTKERYFKASPKKGGPQRKFRIKDELLLILMKLRMSLSNRLLSHLFRISAGTCSSIFNSWIKMLSTTLKPLVFWPGKQTVTDTLPATLAKKFPQLRCTLDCTEVFIERPRHLELQAQTWSDYKRHNTVKFLVAISPNGMICFLSKSWGGRASDRHITRESGFLELVDPNDTILADRGFTIQEDLLLRHATLHIPPPSSGLAQQMRSDVAKTKNIANSRIHVERAIGRIKWFQILKNTLPITLVPAVDDIIMVFSALCNLLPPLVSVVSAVLSTLIIVNSDNTGIVPGKTCAVFT